MGSQDPQLSLLLHGVSETVASTPVPVTLLHAARVILGMADIPNNEEMTTYMAATHNMLGFVVVDNDVEPSVSVVRLTEVLGGDMGRDPPLEKTSGKKRAHTGDFAGESTSFYNVLRGRSIKDMAVAMRRAMSNTSTGFAAGMLADMAQTHNTMHEHGSRMVLFSVPTSRVSDTAPRMLVACPGIREGFSHHIRKQRSWVRFLSSMSGSSITYVVPIGYQTPRGLFRNNANRDAHHMGVPPARDMTNAAHGVAVVFQQGSSAQVQEALALDVLQGISLTDTDPAALARIHAVMSDVGHPVDGPVVDMPSAVFSDRIAFQDLVGEDARIIMRDATSLVITQIRKNAQQAASNPYQAWYLDKIGAMRAFGVDPDKSWANTTRYDMGRLLQIVMDSLHMQHSDIVLMLDRSSTFSRYKIEQLVIKITGCSKDGEASFDAIMETFFEYAQTYMFSAMAALGQAISAQIVSQIVNAHKYGVLCKAIGELQPGGMSTAIQTIVDTMDDRRDTLAYIVDDLLPAFTDGLFDTVRAIEEDHHWPECPSPPV